MLLLHSVCQGIVCQLLNSRIVNTHTRSFSRQDFVYFHLLGQARATGRFTRTVSGDRLINETPGGGVSAWAECRGAGCVGTSPEGGQQGAAERAECGGRQGASK